MPIVGLGTDLARVARFRTFVTENKTALLGRIFTLGEREYAFAKKDPAPHLAARFAAKESCLKAFGLGLREGITWHDMEIVPDELGRPDLQLTGRAAEIAAAKQVEVVHLSYSHDGDYAVATVILERL
ncbi:MAG: holo-[acyl-carrier-protein] synthase [Desulfuromonadales bacterium]|nr:holo-[acyl-carrier-protein] synthase [Desulfuromonadales bacterium]